MNSTNETSTPDDLLIFVEENHKLVGIVYMLLSATILPIYIPILIIFMKYAEYRKTTAYKIMFSIGIADCLQTIAHFYSGVVILTKCNLGDNIENFMGGLINSAWLAVVPQGLVLALNRLDVFRTSKVKLNSGGYIFPFLLFCCWLFGGGFFVLYMTDYTGIVLQQDGFYWEYDSGNWSNTMGDVEVYTTFSFLGITFSVYLIIVICIFHTHKSNSPKIINKKYEYRLLLQAVVTFSYSALNVYCCWNYEPFFLPNSPWTPVIIDMLWILEPSLNPLFYLSLNKTIQQQFLAMFKCPEKRVSTQVSIIITTSNKRLSFPRVT